MNGVLVAEEPEIRFSINGSGAGWTMAASKSSASVSPTPRSARSSLVKLLAYRAPVEPLALEPTFDCDALDALAWFESGMPDGKVGYGPDAPQLTPEQLGELAPASYVPVSESVPVQCRAAQDK